MRSQVLVGKTLPLAVSLLQAPHPHPAPLFERADLVLRMLTKDPAARTKTDQMLKHPWLVRHGVASEKPLPPLVITRVKKFAGLNRLKKVGLRLG